ncbi:MAG TPA: DUF6526 family protein [Thermoanaerobaculia bacterium]|jgi:hypothetical protein
MADRALSYATHRKYDWRFHFVAFPILAVNVGWRIVAAVRRPSIVAVWEIAVAIALVMLAYAARSWATRLQDRIIRTEERARLRQLAPDVDPEHFSIGQLVALRFCSDEELPELARAVLRDDIRQREEIKQRIRTWRADPYRV